MLSGHRGLSDRNARRGRRRRRRTAASLTAAPEEHACAFAGEHSRERVTGESRKGKRESVLFIGIGFSNLHTAVGRKRGARCS